ncbi:MAG: TolC family protein [Acidobacteria bacterium]|nr:TolC family protein [Acidobacteriota bacterium]MCW5970769.1 TolC family protein [Blastocatellales bacterium]
MKIFVVFLIASISASVSFAQESTSTTLTLRTAVESAQRNYPSIRAAESGAAAGAAGADLARTTYLPRLDLVFQENRATRNNIFGLIFQQSVIPPISGPQLDTTTNQSTWGSSAGVLASWEPFDFGLRRAQVNAAEAQRSQAEANAALTRLDAATAAADAFLAALAADESVRAVGAAVARMETFLGAVRALAAQELRPGVDVSRAEAELAALRNQLIQAEQGAELARVRLSEAIGMPGAELRLDSGDLLAAAPPDTPATLDLTAHPMLRAQSAVIAATAARLDALKQSYAPRFNLQSALFARGSGARLDGTFDNRRGWYPDIGNWAVGITITFSAFDLFGLRAKQRIEAHQADAERARYDQAHQTLKAQQARARAMLAAAHRMTANTPAQVRASRETLDRINVRYEYGLATVPEVAEAQLLLARAEVEDAMARLGVWRALLAAARAEGDIGPFLDRTTGRR